MFVSDLQLVVSPYSRHMSSEGSGGEAVECLCPLPMSSCGSKLSSQPLRPLQPYLPSAGWSSVQWFAYLAYWATCVLRWSAYHAWHNSRRPSFRSSALSAWHNSRRPSPCIRRGPPIHTISSKPVHNMRQSSMRDSLNPKP